MKPWELHPALSHFPIALLLVGVAVDLWALRKSRENLTRTAAGLYVGGVLSAIPTALAGLLAWFTAPHSDEVHTIMYWHPVSALATTAVFGVVAFRRWKSRSERAGVGMRTLALFGAVSLFATGYLGSHLVYRGGAGVVSTGASHEHGGAGHEQKPGDGRDHESGGGHENMGPRPPSAEDALRSKGVVPPKPAEGQHEHKK